MSHLALQKAIDLLGSQTALARAIGTKQQTVWTWLNVSKRVPAEACAKIEYVTSGAVTRSDLRPDLWPPVRPATATAQAGAQ